MHEDLRDADERDDCARREQSETMKHQQQLSPKTQVATHDRRARRDVLLECRHLRRA